MLRILLLAVACLLAACARDVPRHRSIGVQVGTLPGPLVEEHRLWPLSGVHVVTVLDQSPAMWAGIRSGDVIYAVDGKTVHTCAELSRLVNAGGERFLRLSVFRQGEKYEIITTFHESDAATAPAAGAHAAELAQRRRQWAELKPDGGIRLMLLGRDNNDRSYEEDDRSLEMQVRSRRAIREPPKPSAPPLGSALNPVRCDGPEGERAYLSRLRDATGRPPAFRRLGSTGQGPYGNILDHYAVAGAGGGVYMDMYHPGWIEPAAVPGFSLAPP